MNAAVDGAGGSPYLQAKLENAKVSLIKEFAVEEPDPKSEEEKKDDETGNKSSPKS